MTQALLLFRGRSDTQILLLLLGGAPRATVAMNANVPPLLILFSCPFPCHVAPLLINDAG